MNRAIPPVLFILLSACGPQPQEVCAEKLQKLESMRAEASAGLIRQRAECQATAVEFHGDARVMASCMETLRVMTEQAQQTFAMIEARRRETDMAECKAQYIPEADVHGRAPN